MTRDEQREFVRDLIENVREDLLARAQHVPPDWDGIELRWWIADRFQAAARRQPHHTGRFRRYRSAVRSVGEL